MTMLPDIPPLRARAIAMPHMREMLGALHAASLALHNSTPAYLVWRRVKNATQQDGYAQRAHIDAARILFNRHRDECAAACEAKDSDRLAALAMVPVKVWLETIAKEQEK